MSLSPPLASRTDAIVGSAIRDLLALTAQPHVISLAGGLPSPDVMPRNRIRDVTADLLGRSDAVYQYAETTGVQRLREVIARRESVRTAATVSASSVVVTHGSQQALSLLASVLLDPGDTVVVDSPVYTGALQCFQAAGATIASVPADAHGTDTAALQELLATGLRPRVVHTVSNFHNPRGTTLSADRRRHLADLAEQYQFWILDDDPYGDVWFDTPPPQPISSPLAIRLGSASKILAPALRVGWLTGPRAVCEAVERLKQSADLCGSALTQLVAADLLEDTDWLDGHLAMVRSVYRSRARALVVALETHFGATLDFEHPTGGMFAWVRFTDGTDTTELLTHALDEGVAFVPGVAFAPEPGGPTTSARLCFATSTEGELAEAMRRLAVAHAAPSGRRRTSHAAVT